MKGPRKVEKQQRDQHEEEDRRNDPDFSQHLYLSFYTAFYALRPNS